jgi:nucleotide-binding universal stress UspA family protein
MFKLLIAVDGSDHSLRTIEAVANLAKASLKFGVVLLNVRDATPLYGHMPSLSVEPIEKARAKEQEQILATAAERAYACHLTVVETRSAQGPVAQEIVRAATECGAHQIVIGTHGLGAIGSFFMGSVAQRVVHLAEVPVLLVK